MLSRSFLCICKDAAAADELFYDCAKSVYKDTLINKLCRMGPAFCDYSLKKSSLFNV